MARPLQLTRQPYRDPRYEKSNGLVVLPRLSNRPGPDAIWLIGRYLARNGDLSPIKIQFIIVEYPLRLDVDVQHTGTVNFPRILQAQERHA
jgi:hypothetical protein